MMLHAVYAKLPQTHACLVEVTHQEEGFRVVTKFEPLLSRQLWVRATVERNAVWSVKSFEVLNELLQVNAGLLQGPVA